MTSSTPNTCQKCGKTILEGSPRGLCGLCLLSAVAKSDEPIPSDAPSPELDDLRRVFPQLEILEPLGAGGMGRVYKVRQPNLDRLVALKLLPPAYAADPEWIERFTREARALARLNHPNIVQVYDFGETAPGENGERFPYLLMEFVDGVNLRQALRTGALTAREALTIVPSVCAALQYAHDQGVLHRDIKPENILLDTLGRVKIADFGLAKLGGDSAPGLTLTGTGVQLGTAAYMAPEQIEKPHDVDHRADIYSLGVVFYELLTGELPLGRFLSPSEKSGTDPRLDTIVFRTLEKERDRRFQSATDMRTEVENVANHPAPEPTPAPEYGPDEWMIRCASCGRTGALAAVGGVRMGAASIGKRTLIRCSNCGGVREGIVAKLRDLPPGTVPVAPAGAMTLAEENKPRLSKVAVTGTVLVLIGIPFIAIVGLIVPYAMAAQNNVGVRPTWILTMLPILAGLFGLVPAIAGTICGWVGLAQIRNSAGALRGAGRATFAALFFPALVFIAFAPVFFGRIFHTGWPVLVGLVLAIAAAVWTARALCRHAENGSENSASRPVRWPWLIGLGALACVLLLPALGLLLPYFAMRSPMPAGLLHPSAGMADVVTPDRAPFIGRLPEGSIELVAVSHHPAISEASWKMDGSPAKVAAVSSPVADIVAKSGERAFVFLFHVNNLPEGTRLLDWEVGNSEGWSCDTQRDLEAGPDKRINRNIGLTARLPAGSSTADIRAGFGFGEWATIIDSGPQSVGGSSPLHEGVRWQLGWSSAIETKDGEIISNWNVKQNRDWESRVVAVRKNGEIVATNNHTTGQDQTEWRFSGVPMHELKTFYFQVRRVQWVEFRGVKLAPALPAKTAVKREAVPSETATCTIREVYCVAMDARITALGIAWDSGPDNEPEIFVRSEKMKEPSITPIVAVVSGLQVKRQRRAWTLELPDYPPEIFTAAGREALQQRIAVEWLDKPASIAVGEERLLFSVPLAGGGTGRVYISARQRARSRDEVLISAARQHLASVGRDVTNPMGIASAEHGLAIAEARGDTVKIAKANLTLARTLLSHERVRRERGYPADLDLVEAERVVKETEQKLEAARAKASAVLEKSDVPKP